MSRNELSVSSFNFLFENDLPKGSYLGNCDVDVLNILSRFSLSERRTTLKFSPKLCYIVF